MNSSHEQTNKQTVIEFAYDEDNNKENGYVGTYNESLKDIHSDNKLRKYNEEISKDCNKQLIEPYMIFDVNHSVRQLKNDINNQVISLSSIQQEINEFNRNIQSYNNTNKGISIPLKSADIIKTHYIQKECPNKGITKITTHNKEYADINLIDDIFLAQKPQGQIVNNIKKENIDIYNEKKLLNDRNSALIEENINLQTRLNYTNNEFAKVLEKYKIINDKLDNAINTTINQLTLNNNALSKENKKIKDLIKEKDDENLQMIESFTKDKDLLIKQLNQLHIEKTQSTMSYENLVINMNIKLRSLAQENTTIKINHDEAHEKNNELISSLQGQLTIENNEKNDLRNKVKSLCGDNELTMLKMQQLNNDIAILNEENNTLKALLQDKELEYKINLKRLNDENVELIEKVRELSLSDISLIKNIKNFQKDNDSLIKELNSKIERNEIIENQLYEIYEKLIKIDNVEYSKLSFKCLIEKEDQNIKHKMLLQQLDILIETFNDFIPEIAISKNEIEEEENHNKPNEITPRLKSNRELIIIDIKEIEIKERILKDEILFQQLIKENNSLEIIKKINEDNQSILEIDVVKEQNVLKNNYDKQLLMKNGNKNDLSKEIKEQKKTILSSSNILNLSKEDDIRLDEEIKERQESYDGLLEKNNELIAEINKLNETVTYLQKINQETSLLNNQLISLSEDHLDNKEVIISQERQIIIKDLLPKEHNKQLKQLNTLIQIPKDKFITNDYVIADKDNDNYNNREVIEKNNIETHDLTNLLTEEDLHIIKLFLSETNPVNYSEIKLLNISNEDKITKYEQLEHTLCQCLQEERLKNAILKEEIKRLKRKIEQAQTLDSNLIDFLFIIKSWKVAFKDFNPITEESKMAFNKMQQFLKGYNPDVVIDMKQLHLKHCDQYNNLYDSNH